MIIRKYMIQKNPVSRYYPYLNDGQRVSTIKAASSFNTALAKTNAKDRRTVQQIRVRLCWKVNKQTEIIACNRRHAYNKGHNKGDLSLSLINLMFSVDAKHHERRRPETPMAIITCTGMRVNRYTSSTTKVRLFRVWHKPSRKVRTCYVWVKTHPIASQLSSRVVYRCICAAIICLALDDWV